MAKIKHPNQVDIIYDSVTDNIQKGLAHITLENKSNDGRIVHISGKECINFGSYSYLGLEMHPKLKQGAINAINKFGTQFPSSRTYLSLPIYAELVKLMEKIFEKPVIVTPSTTLAHLAFIPSVIESTDLVILDQLVHYTVQNPMNICKANGTTVTIIRHNRMDALEDLIKENINKYNKIWYMADGVYSMYGDTTPVKDLVTFLNKYHNFHLYIDDAHGMSWAGKNGRGWFLNQTELHPKMVVALSMAKAFGSGGGVLVFPNEELKERVSRVGGSLIFTGPLSPSEIGAAVASAKIHLSPEINELQAKHRENVDYFNYLLSKTNLPLLDENNCPVFYFGMGLPRVGQNMVKKLLSKGLYVNIVAFPAVSMRSAGIRVSITTHLKKEDIKSLVDNMINFFPKVLEEENYSLERIYKDFKGTIKPKVNINAQIKSVKTRIFKNLNLEYTNTITKLDSVLWNNLLGDNGIFDYDGMTFLEKSFKNNKEKKDNWKFHYFIIYNKEQKPVLATFFTECIWKDDMLSPEGVSKAIEEKRKEDPYYLTSRTITMGSMITEGKHLYIDKTSPDWKDAMDFLLEKVHNIKDKSEATQIVMRDFDETDLELKDYFTNQGFVKIALPETNIVEGLNWNSSDEFLKLLSKKSRSHVRNTMLKYEHFYDVEVVNNISDKELNHIYNLYINVQQSNLELNLFSLSIQFFKNILKKSNWEFIILRLKEGDKDLINNVIAAGICYKSENTYTPLFAALDYKYLHTHSNYRQLLYQVVKRAKNLGKKKIYFGLTASLEKTRLGAVSKSQVVYLQADDNYKLEKIANMVPVSS